jgi:hypothetical protein
MYEEKLDISSIKIKYKLLIAEAQEYFYSIAELFISLKLYP